MGHSSVYLGSSHKRTGICAESLSAITNSQNMDEEKQYYSNYWNICSMYVCLSYIRPDYVCVMYLCPRGPPKLIRLYKIPPNQWCEKYKFEKRTFQSSENFVGTDWIFQQILSIFAAKHIDGWIKGLRSVNEIFQILFGVRVNWNAMEPHGKFHWVQILVTTGKSGWQLILEAGQINKA